MEHTIGAHVDEGYPNNGKTQYELFKDEQHVAKLALAFKPIQCASNEL